MPKNKGKGGKNRRRGKNENEGMKRELVFREDGQEYAQVTKMLGNGRVEAMCFDGEKRLCHIRGKLRKKVWINNGDIILLGLRDYQKEKADVILKYSTEEARSLKSYGEFPTTVKINEVVSFGTDQNMDDEIEFDDVDNDSNDEDVRPQSDRYGNNHLPTDSSDEDDEEDDDDDDDDLKPNTNKWKDYRSPADRPGSAESDDADESSEKDAGQSDEETKNTSSGQKRNKA